MTCRALRRLASLRGFTLVELLIALAILASMAVLGYRALASLADSETRLAAEAQRWRALDGFFARLEADVRAAVPREARYGASIESAWVAREDADGNAELRFSRAASEFGQDAAGGGQRLGYRLREGSVEVLYWPRFDRRMDSVPVSYAIVDGVARLRIDYLDARGTWRDRWPSLGETPLPRAMRVGLALADGALVERTLVLQ